MLALIRTKYPEYHPLLAIADLAHDPKIDDPRIQLECHKTIIKYVTPELKSVEVKAEIKETRRVIVSLFDGSDMEAIPNTATNSAPALAVQEDPLWNKMTDVADAELIDE